MNSSSQVRQCTRGYLKCKKTADGEINGSSVCTACIEKGEWPDFKPYEKD